MNGALSGVNGDSGAKSDDRNVSTVSHATKGEGSIITMNNATNGESSVVNHTTKGESSMSVPNGTMNGLVNGDHAQVPYQGVDLTADAADATYPISWHVPHALFAIFIVGPEEQPFGIQKDILIAKCPYYREDFSKGDKKVELVVYLPDVSVTVFGCFQVFLYTGKVYEKEAGRPIPEYSELLGVWSLAVRLRMPLLRVAVLDAFAERRQLTNLGPGPSLIIKAWEETKEGSGLRRMLITWAAEHMHTPAGSRSQFSKALPQEILAELVVAMAEYANGGLVRDTPPLQIQAPPVNLANEINLVEQPRTSVKRNRKSEVSFVNGNDDAYEVKPVIKKQARRSEPTGRKNNRRISTQVQPIPMDSNMELNYCRDLIGRMMSGPGFWTRLVGPFKDPVDPILHNVPNYFDVIKRPMDLRTIHGKMSRNEYSTATDFEADVRLIFQNCYEYWTENDKPFKDCIAFEKYFNEQWSNRQSWKAPTIKTEVID